MKEQYIVLGEIISSQLSGARPEGRIDINQGRKRWGSFQKLEELWKGPMVEWNMVLSEGIKESYKRGEGKKPDAG